MGKINQIIAIEKGVKSRSYAEIDSLRKVLKKQDLFNGFAKEYQPKEEGAETLPPEKKIVAHTTSAVLADMDKSWSDYLNITARKDWSNCAAKANVVVDGNTLLADVPVTYLLFLEKQITDLRTIVTDIPTLDPAETWIKDENSGLFTTQPVMTHRTKKVPKVVVMYPAMDKHPAQTQLLQEDITDGHWRTVKQSGAMPATEKRVLVDKLEKLLRAVKEAREAANGADESDSPNAGDAIFRYLR